DAGTMSAWYVFSALGFYPVCPGSNTYQIGSPLFKEAVVHLNKAFYPGGLLILKTINNSADHPYLQSVLVDGLSYRKTFLKHDALIYGKTIVFKMSGHPQK
ncbi:MAG TPA: glycoside hydrolase domain-containing protein, partial [bacterium]